MKAVFPPSLNLGYSTLITNHIVMKVQLLNIIKLRRYSGIALFVDKSILATNRNSCKPL